MKTKRIRKTVGFLGLALMLAAAGCAGAAGSEKESNEATGSQSAGESNEATGSQGAGESNEATGSQGAGEGKASGEGLGGKNNSGQEEKSMDYAEIFKGMKLAKSYKGFQNNNPIIEQHYGADPFAMVYGDEVYFYMTADAYERDASGEIATNTYGKIRSLYVVSTKDMINFTDHGEITIAGAGGATKWAHNSWAPAAAWKECPYHRSPGTAGEKHPPDSSPAAGRLRICRPQKSRPWKGPSSGSAQTGSRAYNSRRQTR